MKSTQLHLRPATYLDRPECPLCASDLRTVVWEFSVIPIVRCGKCGFMYSSRILDAGSLENYYKAEFGSERHRLGQQINAMVNSYIVSALLAPKRGARLLDVGSGYGYFVRRVIDGLGVDAEGVELSEGEASFAKTKLGIRVYNGPPESAPLPRDTFDIVTSFEVIEHVARPREFVALLASFLEPGGYLVICTDNFGSRAATRMGAAFPKWIPHSHVSHFESQTLRALVASLPGLDVTKEASFTPWELISRMIVRPKTRERPNEAFDLDETLATEMTGTLRMAALRRHLNPLWVRLTLRNDLAGSLMFIVARKRCA